jgi:hypothetical protein
MKLCPYCKVALARDDARFCQNCGKAVAARSLIAHPVSSTPVAATQPELLEDTLSVPAVKKVRKHHPALPEQIARQPESVAHTYEAQPVAGNEAAQPGPLSDTASEPFPVTEAPAHPLSTKPEPPAAAPAVLATAAPNTPATTRQLSPTAPPAPPSQELMVREQEQDALVSKDDNHERQADTPREQATSLLSSDADGTPVEPQEASQKASSDTTDLENEQKTRPVLVQPIPARFSAFPDTVSRLTSPMPSLVQPVRSGSPWSFSLSDAAHRLTSSLQSTIRYIAVKCSRLFSPLHRPVYSVPALQSVRQRLSGLPGIVIVVALVLAALGSWLLIDQPFSVPLATRPQLAFNDVHMGIALSYPNGWTTRKNASDSTVQFSDSSHTAQVIITVSDIKSVTITASLQKQSAQLGLSEVKNVAPRSFAGASWQGMQGTVQQNGASYTCTIFATIHANRLVILTQLAPQSVYDQEDSLVFSALRRSLQFV